MSSARCFKFSTTATNTFPRRMYDSVTYYLQLLDSAWASKEELTELDEAEWGLLKRVVNKRKQQFVDQLTGKLGRMKIDSASIPSDKVEVTVSHYFWPDNKALQIALGAKQNSATPGASYFDVTAYRNFHLTMNEPYTYNIAEAGHCLTKQQVAAIKLQRRDRPLRRGDGDTETTHIPDWQEALTDEVSDGVWDFITKIEKDNTQYGRATIIHLGESLIGEIFREGGPFWEGLKEQVPPDFSCDEAMSSFKLVKEPRGNSLEWTVDATINLTGNPTISRSEKFTISYA